MFGMIEFLAVCICNYSNLGIDDRCKQQWNTYLGRADTDVVS